MKNKYFQFFLCKHISSSSTRNPDVFYKQFTYRQKHRTVFFDKQPCVLIEVENCTNTKVTIIKTRGNMRMTCADLTQQQVLERPDALVYCFEKSKPNITKKIYEFVYECLLSRQTFLFLFWHDPIFDLFHVPVNI